MKIKYTYLIIIFLIAASLAAFGRIAGNDFINLDDIAYITENSNIKSGINPQSIKWAFTDIVVSNWVPLALISHMLDWSLFGADPSGHHLVNLLLHIGSVIFLFLFLCKTTNNIWPAAFAAALFALHPLRVESVAWAAERKDVLSMFFGMAALYAYAFYAESFRLSRYFLSLILFALSLLSKSMLVTLPFVFLLLDYWPLGRWQKALTAPLGKRSRLMGRIIGEKVPFIFLTILPVFITILAQSRTAAYTPFPARVTNAIVVYVLYLEKTFWPADLVLLSYSAGSFPLWQIVASCIILGGITFAVIYFFKKAPFLCVGWFWYLGTLIPVSGLVPTYALFADHYTYLPSIGLAIMLGWGFQTFIKSKETRMKIIFPGAVVILAVLAVLTWRQCGYWKNSIELWNHALQVTRDNPFAHMNRGIAYSKIGERNLAIEDFNEAIRLKPDYILAYFNRGNAYISSGLPNPAIEDYNEAIRLKPDFILAYNNRALAYIKLGRHKPAIDDYSEAIRLKPYYTYTFFNRGTAYFKNGQYELAVKDYNEVIRLNPDYANAYSSRGLAYLKQGDKEQGCRDVKKACELGKCELFEAAQGGYCR
jgi:tetratricopeptide (TPR) repeat protein